MSLKPKVVNFELVWGDLSRILKAVMVCESINRTDWNDKFNDVYSLCVANPEPLHSRLYAETKKFIESHVENIMELIEASGDENLLNVYFHHWQKFSTGAGFIDMLYRYLNLHYVKKNKPSEADARYASGPVAQKTNEDVLEIGELAHDAWRRLLWNRMQKSVVDGLLTEIDRDRHHSCTTSQTVIHGVIHSLVAIEVASVRSGGSSGTYTLYREAFEEPFLAATSDYYRAKATEITAAECSCGEFLEKAIQLIEEENVRSRKFLNHTSYNKVTEKVQERLSLDHIEMLHSECKNLVKNELTTDLSRMYQLLQPIKKLRPLCSELESHIEGTGLQAIQSGTSSENTSTHFVESMLALHSKYHAMIKTTFRNDQQFIAVLDKACSNVINHRPTAKSNCKSPELLVKYCDQLLRKNSKGLTEADVDEKLSSSITVFKYLSDKDIYQAVYQRMLCKRLIYKHSSSMDAEEAMINRLKQTCGYEFTNKLHRMFTDIKISADLSDKYLTHRKPSQQLQLDHNFSILVLQAGSWPIQTQRVPSFQLPAILEQALTSFETFYSKEFSGRKLTWTHAYSTGELKLNYLKKPYYLTVGLFQLGILLMFNDADKLKLDEIVEGTQLEKDVCKERHMTPLVESKMLTEDEVYYSLNFNYQNKRTKFKLTPFTMKETPQETERVRASNEEDRKWLVQAAIVRIMKARKTIKHNLLIEEVIKQMVGRFDPSIAMIKKAVEALIDKQYIERTKNNKDEYGYIA